MDQSGGGQSYGTEGNGGVSSSNMTEQQGTEQAQQSQAQQEAALRKIRTFYFDFDTSEIKPEARNVLMAHAHYLASHPSVHVKLQGYTDERGTQEYNLALGQRRANAVKQFLVVNGVSPDQIATISYGEENPAAKGHNEAAWAKNRRVVMIYQ
jgi:peptidoglycan-associated lipoprotein